MRYGRLAIAAALLLASCGSGGGTPGEGQPAPDMIGTRAEGCARFFPAGQQPVLESGAMKKTRTLCRRSFALLHSGVARQPLWVAEMITWEQIKLARSTPRTDRFSTDKEIPEDERSELKDYGNPNSESGSSARNLKRRTKNAFTVTKLTAYDRGHMAPEGDMPSEAASKEAFMLSNMSPQAPGLNRGTWRSLETSVRDQSRGGKVFILTGPLFESKNLRTVKKGSRVLVPTHFFKAIYAVDRGATVFVATNENSPKWQSMTVDQFRIVYRINAFPGMKDEFRNINGVLNGTLNRVASGTAGVNAQASDGAGGGSVPNTTDPMSGEYIPAQATCRTDRDRNVQDPQGGRPLTPQEYSMKYKRSPKMQEFCPS